MLTRILTRAVGGLICLAVAVPALGSGEGESPDIFAGGIGNAIVTLIVFAAVVFILGKYGWPPLLRVLSDREKAIRDSLEQAKADREEAERVLEKYTRQIEQARNDASRIIEQGRRNAEDAARRVHDQARADAADMVTRAKREIQLATDTAKKEVYDVAAELAVDVAGRIIHKELSPADHRELVAESLARMKAEDRKLS